jgi:hypothetical protein
MLFGHQKDCPTIRFEYLGFIGRRHERRKKRENENVVRVQKGFYFDSAKQPFDSLTNMCSGAVIRILENSCRTVHGTVIGYKPKTLGDDNNIVPVLGPSLKKMHGSDVYQITYFRSFNAGLREGFVEWAPANWEENSMGFKQRLTLAQKILKKAISSPTLDETAAFLSIPYQQDGGVDALQTLKGFSPKMFLPGNRSVWIPGNLSWHGLSMLNSMYIRLWTTYKAVVSLRIGSDY